MWIDHFLPLMTQLDSTHYKDRDCIWGDRTQGEGILTLDDGYLCVISDA
jgi:hypothetical protein